MSKLKQIVLPILLALSWSEMAGAQTQNVPPSDPSSPMRVSGVLSQDGVLTKVQPVYPAIARAAHISGTVLLRAIISKKGKVVQLSVISGPDLLRASALDAVRQWTYRPYLLNGKPVDVDTVVTVNFNFSDTPVPPAPPHP